MSWARQAEGLLAIPRSVNCEEAVISHNLAAIRQVAVNTGGFSQMAEEWRGQSWDGTPE